MRYWPLVLAVALAVLRTLSAAEPADVPSKAGIAYAVPPRNDTFVGYDYFYPDYDPALTAPLSLNVEYVHWWLNGPSLPALVTTSSAGTPVGQAGVFGEPNTGVLFGDDDIDDGGRSGFRASLGVRLGYYFDSLPNYELQLDYLLLGEESGGFAASSAGDPILARPYFDVQAGTQGSEVVAFPGLLEGQVRANTSSDFYSAGAVLKRHWWSGQATRLSFLFGYRYLRLKEDLVVQTANTALAPITPFPVGTAFGVTDSFGVWNEFNGADIGLDARWHRGAWSLDVLAKLAVGNIRQKLDIEGLSIVTEPGLGPSFSDFGLLALPSNIGRQTNDRLGLVPELGITLRRWWGQSLQVTMGYTVMAMTEAIRVGDQIDTSVDLSQLAVPAIDARPQAVLDDSILWIQGFRIGVDW